MSVQMPVTLPEANKAKSAQKTPSEPESVLAETVHMCYRRTSRVRDGQVAFREGTHVWGWSAVRRGTFGESRASRRGSLHLDAVSALCVCAGCDHPPDRRRRREGRCAKCAQCRCNVPQSRCNIHQYRCNIPQCRYNTWDEEAPTPGGVGTGGREAPEETRENRWEKALQPDGGL